MSGDKPSKRQRRRLASVRHADEHWAEPVRSLFEQFPTCDHCGDPFWEDPADVPVTDNKGELINPGDCPRCAILIAFQIGAQHERALAAAIVEQEDALHGRGKAREEGAKMLRKLPDDVLRQSIGRDGRDIAAAWLEANGAAIDRESEIWSTLADRLRDERRRRARAKN